MLLLVEIVYEAVFIDTLDRHLDNLPSVGHDDAFVCENIGKILLDGLPHLLLMPGLILVALAVQGPVLARYNKQRLCMGDSLP